MPEIKSIKHLQCTEFITSSRPADLVRTPEMAETANKRNGCNGHNGHLTSGGLLARNTVWNLIGNGAPMIVAVFSIPILIHRLGQDRFGVLALAWALIGYASLFDLGLGRALTQLVAKKLGAGEDREVPALVWTSLILMLLLGLAGPLAAMLLAPWLVHRVLNVPVGLQVETLRSLYMLGVSIPVVISTAGLRGLLEAYQEFGLINTLRIPMGVYSFAGPLLVLPFSKSLVPVVGVLVAGRVVGWAAHLWLCLKVVPALRHGIVWQGAVVNSLLRFGGWITVANVVNPLLVFMDRALIGALLPVAMVGYYTAPFEAVTKLWMIPASLTATVFPACSALGASRKKELQRLYSRCVKYLLLILAPVSLAIGLFATQIVQIWLGPDFAAKSAVVLQILALGVFVNCFAHVPYCFLQGLGRPDTTAKVFLAELAPYAAFAWWMIRGHGIVGAATAWSVRAGLEAVLLVLMGWRMFSLSPRFLVNKEMQRGFAALCALGLAMVGTKMTLHDSIKTEICLATVFLTGFVLVSWKYVLDDSDRGSVVTLFGPLWNAVRDRGVA
jgi:O-antigen/teichoic acid export membrane protein